MSDGGILELQDVCNKLGSPIQGDTNIIPQTNQPVIDLQSAVQNFEKDLLVSLLPNYPSSRKLAKQLNVSHNTIALKLKKYNLG
jgi:TyrR family helix-turn-helix protein